MTDLQGWICPRCLQVWGPFVPRCDCPPVPVTLSAYPTYACTCGSTCGTGVCPLHGGTVVVNNRAEEPQP